MVLKETEDALKRLKSKPRPTLLLLFAVLLVVAGGAFVVAYFSEAGRQAASDRNEQLSDPSQGAIAAESRTSGTVPADVLKIQQVTYGTGQHRNSVNISVRNASEQPILIQEILLSQSYRDVPDCPTCMEIFDIYQLSATATRNDSIMIVGAFRERGYPEFDYPVSGSFVSAPGVKRVTLRIGVSVPVAPNSIEVVQLFIPVRIRASAQIRVREGRERDGYLALSAVNHLWVGLCTSAGEASFSATLKGSQNRASQESVGAAVGSICRETTDSWTTLR